MALKDWKKFGEDEWYNKKDKYSFAKVWKIVLSAPERKRRGIGLYGFSGRVGRDGNTTKQYFKNKKLALEFAQKWMRTH